LKSLKVITPIIVIEKKMGIPFYFREIVNNNPHTLVNKIKDGNACNTCTNLFLDYNSIIHTCSAAVVSKMNNEYTVDAILNEIIKYTNYVTELCTPTDLLFIAVDGLAPRAKIQQQRRRRYISAYKNDRINKFKTDNGVPVTDWDSNCITPGTAFMVTLDKFLKSYYATHDTPYKVIVSGHDEAGEGEHKIIRYIKQQSMTDLTGSDEKGITNVIYGLDADLIMLSLSCEVNNIFLMRETQTDGYHKQTICKYLDITALRVCISDFLYKGETSYMYDYIFICFLLGNDFLPHASFLQIKNGAVETLCQIYRKLYDVHRQNLIIRSGQNFGINHTFLVNFFEMLSKIEDDGMKKAVEQHDRIVFNPQRRFQNKLERFLYELESYPLLNPSVTDIDPHGDSSWRNSYYYHLHGSNGPDVIKQCTLNYIQGLLWTVNYYFNQAFDKQWYYRFDYSPCITDLYKYICTMNSNSMNALQKQLSQTNSSSEINAIVQLFMVLPPQSRNILPNNLQHIFNDIRSGCTHYFPMKYGFKTFLKTQLWECIPILPDIYLPHLHEKLTSVL
jgi:5'-3' exoribonuclease 1